MVNMVKLSSVVLHVAIKVLEVFHIFVTQSFTTLPRVSELLEKEI